MWVSGKCWRRGRAIEGGQADGVWGLRCRLKLYIPLLLESSGVWSSQLGGVDRRPFSSIERHQRMHARPKFIERQEKDDRIYVSNQDNNVTLEAF
jgi:hypothetical protein